MKSIVLNLLSLMALVSSIPAIAHQDIIKQSKSNIDVMLEDINTCCTKSNLSLDDIADTLYTKYRNDSNFQELIQVFIHIQKNCILFQNYPFESHPFEYALANIKQYLNGTENIKRNQIAWVLFIRYNTNNSFGTMRRIFEKIANDQEKAQKRYLEAIETIRKLKNFTTLGIGRYR